MGGWVGSQGQSGQVWKILLPPGFEPCTIQPIMSHYTNNAILGHLANMGIQISTPKTYKKKYGMISIPDSFLSTANKDKPCQ
jgi:hypothetical protein